MSKHEQHDAQECADVATQQQAAQRDAIDAYVRLQQRMVRRWGTFVAGCVDRLQSGNFETGPWLEAYGQLADDAARDFDHAVEMLAKLGGKR